MDVPDAVTELASVDPGQLPGLSQGYIKNKQFVIDLGPLCLDYKFLTVSYGLDSRESDMVVDFWNQKLTVCLLNCRKIILVRKLYNTGFACQMSILVPFPTLFIMLYFLYWFRMPNIVFLLTLSPHTC